MATATSQKMTAWQDISASLANFRLAALLGWQDVAQRYRRSSVGAFWLTINMGVLIGALGLVFGTIFNTPMSEFLPFICVGLIMWGYFSSLVTEGCGSFVANTETMLQLPIPFFTYILRTWWRNTIILAHNIIIFPLVLLIFGKFVNFDALLAIPGFILVSVNLLWVMVILAVLCTRYRDLTQIVQNIMQVGMYVTPIMWMPKNLPGGARSQLMLDYNPFYHLISIVREPLLGGVATPLNWVVSIGMALIGWVVALLFLNRYRTRITYWL
ncbi:lipopolysaccharide transport system permease protein [Phyllobacterium sp. YR620]|uniref:ABC transporter permease n=1 Tax=unclassified Phyllobacterium TaxID=2638441 RepID=UPI0008856E1C|nr:MULTISPECIES: ABC transporter permease [unclassified Phyllobacterium]SDP81128.1 lipopolysaccharide transport system permease protein [Phyllobacterium sp. YR620]SFI65455.1 lipopolysaccharide transport system permease protein [Phyllobacterium sp. CL33Tsu]